MSGLKSVIITLPKGTGLVKTEPSDNNNTIIKTKQQQIGTIIVDSSRIKLENIKHMEHHNDNTTLIVKQEVGLVQQPRGKKRRLDHLTWEEKLQRKKLKNRVAAQTSRDRKKAKLDDLEDTVRILKERNEILMEECEMLREQNESLVMEADKLKQDKESLEAKESNKEKQQICKMCQDRVGCTVPALGSAAGWDSTNGTTSDIESKRNNTPEDPDSLSPLEDLFSEFQGDDYIERLEELAESLLREVTTQVETSPSQPDEQNSIKKENAKKSDDTKKLVGEAPSDVGTTITSSGSIALNARQVTQTIPKISAVPIIPKLTLNSSGPITITEKVKIKEEPIHDTEMVYGTYDEATNCITIIYPEEDVTRLSPHHQPQLFSPVHSYESMSPSSMHSEDTDLGGVPSTKLDGMISDGGYESHGSPASSDIGNNTLTDLWHESFSELFPSLA